MDELCLTHNDMAADEIASFINNGEEYLQHFNVKGSHWYQRRFQNKDGSLTPLGRIHYGVGKARSATANTVKKIKKASDDRAEAKHQKYLAKEKAKEEKKFQKKVAKQALKDAEKANLPDRISSMVLDKKNPESVDRMIEAATSNIDAARRKKAHDELSDSITKAIKEGKTSDEIKEIVKDTSSKYHKQESVDDIIRSGDAKKVYENRDRMTDQEVNAAINRINLNKRLKELQPKEKSKGEKLLDTIMKVKDAADKGYQVYQTVDKWKKVFDGTNEKQKQKSALKETIDKAISSGDWKTIDKYKSEMTMNQLNEVFQRQNQYDAIKAGLNGNDWRSYGVLGGGGKGNKGKKDSNNPNQNQNPNNQNGGENNKSDKKTKKQNEISNNIDYSLSSNSAYWPSGDYETATVKSKHYKDYDQTDTTIKDVHSSVNAELPKDYSLRANSSYQPSGTYENAKGKKMTFDNYSDVSVSDLSRSISADITPYLPSVSSSTPKGDWGSSSGSLPKYRDYSDISVDDLSSSFDSYVQIGSDIIKRFS